MFGTYRLALALLVLLDHFGGLRGAGFVAVYAFFCLSGFLMTVLITGTYAGRPGAFLLNRFLRLYPLYWAVFVVTMALLPALPASPWVLLRQAGYAVTFWDDVKVVHVAWAVTSELVFYVAIGLGLTSTRRRAELFLAASIAFAAGCYSSGMANVFTLYFHPIGAAVPFALGAMLAHMRHHFTRPAPLIGLGTAGTIGAVAVVHSSANPEVLHWLVLPATHASLLASAALIAGLWSLRPGAVDELLGRFSYPAYLTQSLAAIIATTYGPIFGLGILPAVLLLTFCLSLAGVALVEAPVQVLRSHVRGARLGAWSFGKSSAGPYSSPSTFS